MVARALVRTFLVYFGLDWVWRTRKRPRNPGEEIPADVGYTILGIVLIRSRLEARSRERSGLVRSCWADAVFGRHPARSDQDFCLRYVVLWCALLVFTRTITRVSLHFKVARGSRSPCGSADFARGRRSVVKGHSLLPKTELPLRDPFAPGFDGHSRIKHDPFDGLCISDRPDRFHLEHVPREQPTGWSWRLAAE